MHSRKPSNAAPGKFSVLLWWVLISCIPFASANSGRGGRLADRLLPADDAWTVQIDVNGSVRTFRIPEEISVIEHLPAAQRKQALARLRKIRQNQRFIRAAADEYERELKAGKVWLTTDHNRQLNDVVLSVSYSELGRDNPLQRHEPILAGLPAYSRIQIVAPKGQTVKLKTLLRNYKLADRAKVVSSETWTGAKVHHSPFSRPSRWIRDAFMVGKSGNGKGALFVPLAYGQAIDLDGSDLSYVYNLAAKQSRVIRIPLFVRGGNLALTTVGHRKILFVGADELLHNEEAYHAAAQVKPPRKAVLDLLRSMADADQVIVLPNTPHLFHLDMAINFLYDGKAAILKPVDPAQTDETDRRALQDIRSELTKAGVSLIDIPTTGARISRHQSSVNVLPYFNRVLNAPALLLPMFAESLTKKDSGVPSLNDQVVKAYESAGYIVTPIEDRFHELAGNTHCTALGLN